MASTRPYTSRLREQQAAQVRREILATARSLFARSGYVSTTIAQIAQEAGVSAQTVYSAFESKAGLAAALVAYTKEESGSSELAGQVAAAATPRAMLEASVHLVCVMHERVGDLFRVLQDAARADPSLEPAATAARGGHAAAQRRIAGRLAATGVLVEGLSADDAADLLTVVTSPDAVDRYVVEFGWRYRKVEQTLTAAVVRALCAPGAADRPWPSRPA
jgi:AcrR family transcriptional regulator